MCYNLSFMFKMVGLQSFQWLWYSVKQGNPEMHPIWGFSVLIFQNGILLGKNKKTAKQTKPLGTISLHRVSMNISSRNTYMRKI